MSSSSDESTHKEENAKTDVSVSFRRPYLDPSKGHQQGVSIQSFINLGNISQMNYLTDLILGEDFCIFIFFHFYF